MRQLLQLRMQRSYFDMLEEKRFWQPLHLVCLLETAIRFFLGRSGSRSEEIQVLEYIVLSINYTLDLELSRTLNLLKVRIQYTESIY
jgi:hypothetical protein